MYILDLCRIIQTIEFRYLFFVCEYLYKYYCCLISISYNLADKDTSWSDSCAIASSSTLSRGLNDWFNSSNSSIFVVMSVLCSSNWCTFKNAKYVYEDIANEHEVSSRSVQRWVTAYIKKWIDDGVRMKKSGGSKSGITDENKEIILSA